MNRIAPSSLSTFQLQKCVYLNGHFVLAAFNDTNRHVHAKDDEALILKLMILNDPLDNNGSDLKKNSESLGALLFDFNNKYDDDDDDNTCSLSSLVSSKRRAEEVK